MNATTHFDKEVFLSMAKTFGLDTNDPHIEDLYGYVQKVLPTLRCIDELDLKDIEPVCPLTLLSSPESEMIRGKE